MFPWTPPQAKTLHHSATSGAGLLLRLFAVLTLLALPASAQTAEQLQLGLPEGWSKAFETRHGSTEITEFLPAGQSLQDWRDMLVLQVQQGKPVPPEMFLESIPGTLAKHCDNPRAGEVQKGQGNGYAAAFRIVECPLNRLTGKGELSIFLVLQGTGALYAMQRAWQTAPFPGQPVPISREATDEAVAWLRSVTLCDGSAKHPCAGRYRLWPRIQDTDEHR